jgi:hypothetical protein
MANPRIAAAIRPTTASGGQLAGGCHPNGQRIAAPSARDKQWRMKSMPTPVSPSCAKLSSTSDDCCATTTTHPARYRHPKPSRRRIKIQFAGDLSTVEFKVFFTAQQRCNESMQRQWAGLVGFNPASEAESALGSSACANQPDSLHYVSYQGDQFVLPAAFAELTICFQMTTGNYQSSPLVKTPIAVGNFRHFGPVSFFAMADQR